MEPGLTKCLFLIGFLSAFKIATAEDIPPDPVPFNSTGLNAKEDVKFFLYTTSYPDKPRQIYIGDTDGLSQTDYDPKKPTAFITHGWMLFSIDICIPPVRKGFLKHNYNVVVVEWRRIAGFPSYAKAAEKALGIAQYFAKMVDFFVEQGSDPSQMTITGHSLGAHVAGLAAYNSQGGIGHVVAMDPAMPGFTKHGKNGRVHVADAVLVETIHTNTKKLGFVEPITTIDYYPNGGKAQPGCENDPKDPDFCSHLRACLFYGESLSNPDQWLARRCHDDEQFEKGQCNDGVIAPFARWTNRVNRPTGTYYLRTNAKPSFGLGRKGV